MPDDGFTEVKFNFSIAKVVTGYYVDSPEFVVGGNIWKVRCSNRSEFLHIELRLLRGPEKIKAIFEAFAMGSNGYPSSVYATRSLGIFYPTTKGCSTLIWRSGLESHCVVNGWITLMCGVIVVHEGHTTAPPSYEDDIIVPPSEIQSHLGSLLESGDGADVSFRVNGETFRAHRALLAARSPVFRAELLGSMAEAQMPCITLRDIEPAAFELLLQFVYTDALPGDERLGDSPTDTLQHLLAAADRYALDRLKLVCAQKLWKNMSVDTVAGTLACAEMHNCPELKKRCIDFVASEVNFKNVVLTDGFMQLGLKFPSIVAELRQRVRA